MVRSIVAVVVGFVLTGALNLGTSALLSSVAPGLVAPPGTYNDHPAGLLLVCAYVAVYGILGCYVTARLAPSRPCCTPWCSARWRWP